MDGSSEGEVDYAAEAEVWECFSLLLQAAHASAEARQGELRESGTTMMQHAVLFVVKSTNGSASPSEIARQLVRRRHTVWALLNHMERKGLIRKTKDVPRKGMLRISITKEGENVFRRAVANRGVVLEIMSCLSREQMTEFSVYLRSVRDKAHGHLGIRYQVPYP